MEQLTIQSLGFPLGFQEDIKIPRPHETINHTIIRVSFRVREDIKVPRPHGTINHTVSRVSYGFQEDLKISIIIIIIIIIIVIIIVIVVLNVIVACPDARCESGQTSGSCHNVIYIYTIR